MLCVDLMSGGRDELLPSKIIFFLSHQAFCNHSRFLEIFPLTQTYRMTMFYVIRASNISDILLQRDFFQER